MKLIKPFMLLGAFGVTVSVFPSTASAQVGPGGEDTARQLANGQNPLATENQVRVLQVRNNKASFLAWRLDPIHNEMPIEFRLSADLEAQAESKVDKTTEPSTWQELFPGSQSKADQALAKWQERFPGLYAVTPLGAPNQLIAVGTAESFAKVEAELAVLDKPLRQVEVEARSVEADAETIRELGLQLFSFKADNEARPNFDLGVGKTDPDFEQKLNALIEAGKVKVLTAPRVTLISGLYGFIGTEEAIPATIGIKDENGQFQELNVKSTGADSSPQLYLGMQTRFLARATVNDDKTITLYIDPSRKFNLLNLSVSRQQIPFQTIERRQAVLTMRDGEVVALKGATLALSAKDVLAGVQPKNVIMIVTVRLIRRAGD